MASLIPAELTSIVTSNWQMGISGYANIVTDVDDIKLCWRNILFTRIGDVPLDDQFGSLIFDYLDKPITEVRPKITAECLSSLNKYETRAIVNVVTSYLDGDSNLVFSILGTVLASAMPIKYEFIVNVSPQGVARAFSDGYNLNYL